jgi:hypothetical protein
MPNSEPAKARDEPHWPAPVSVAELLDTGLRVVPGLRHGGVGLVASRRATRLRTCSKCLAGVPSIFSSRCARTSGLGRQSLKTSRTGSGISISRSVETSCMINSIGNSGARSSGPHGLHRAGVQCHRYRAPAGPKQCCTSGVGILLSSSRNLVGVLMGAVLRLVCTNASQPAPPSASGLHHSNRWQARVRARAPATPADKARPRPHDSPRGCGAARVPPGLLHP